MAATLRPLLLIALLLLPHAAGSWVLMGQRWAPGSAAIHVDLEEPWRSSFEDAMATWKQSSRFTFQIQDNYRDPCASPSANSVDFSATVCGEEWGEKVLAITIYRSVEANQELPFIGLDNFFEADVLFNANLEWALYSGALRQNRPDFHRVALHELGHVLGLGHEREQPAVMQVSISSEMGNLQDDDIAGANALYRANYRNCGLEEINPRPGAAVSGRISSGDCSLFELLGASSTSGGLGSVIAAKGDAYRLSSLYPLSDESRPLAIRVHAEDLRLFTPLLKPAGNRLAATRQGRLARLKCGALYTHDHLPTEHYLWVGADLQRDEDAAACPGMAASGRYSISVFERSLPILPELPRHPDSEVYFSGGATADDGASYASNFAPDDSIDISASLMPIPTDVGRRASLYLVALVSSAHTLAKTPEGWRLIGSPDTFWERWDDSPFAAFDNLPAYRRTASLAHEERIDVIQGLQGRAAGLSGLVFRVYVGYALEGAAAPIHSHAAPLEFFIRE